MYYSSGAENTPELTMEPDILPSKAERDFLSALAKKGQRKQGSVMPIILLVTSGVVLWYVLKKK